MKDEQTQLFNVSEFCRVHRISRTHFYHMVKAGEGPDLIKLGRRTLISREAAARWRTRLESKGANPAKRKGVA